MSFFDQEIAIPEESSPEFVAHKYDFDEFADRYASEDHDLRRWLAFESQAFASIRDRIIAGGALRALLLNQPVTTDIDYFFSNKDQFDRFVDVAKRIDNAAVVKETQHHITFNVPVGEDTFKIQAIKINFFKNAVSCIDSFDFTICQLALDLKGDLYVGQWSLWDISRKRLVVHKITYAVASLRRFFKYMKQGFQPCTGTLSTFLQQVSANPDSIRGDVQYVD